MSNPELYCEGPNGNLSVSEIRRRQTWRVALVSVFAALGFSLVGVYFLSKNVSFETSSKVAYIQQRLNTLGPSYIAAVKAKKEAM